MAVSNFEFPVSIFQLPATSSALTTYFACITFWTRRFASMREVIVCAIGVATVAACTQQINSKSAVENAIRAHLERNSNLALNTFTTEISDVKFEGDNATAVVKFKSKQAPDVSVQARYSLRKEGNQW